MATLAVNPLCCRAFLGANQQCFIHVSNNRRYCSLHSLISGESGNGRTAKEIHQLAVERARGRKSKHIQSAIRRIDEFLKTGEIPPSDFGRKKRKQPPPPAPDTDTEEEMEWGSPVIYARPEEDDIIASSPGEGPSQARDPGEGPSQAGDPGEGPSQAGDPGEGPPTKKRRTGKEPADGLYTLAEVADLLPQVERMKRILRTNARLVKVNEQLERENTLLREAIYHRAHQI